MKITVTQEDIDNGERGVPVSCPIALAIQRVTGKRTSVTGSRLRVVGGLSYSVTPHSVAEFIFAFDTGGTVEPFTFEL